MEKYDLKSSNSFVEEFLLNPHQRGALDNLTFAIKGYSLPVSVSFMTRQNRDECLFGIIT